MPGRLLRRLAALSVPCIVALSATASAQDANVPLPPPKSRESIAGVDVVYMDAAVANGDRVRLIVTRPRAASGPLPLVFTIGWLSCDSVNWPNGPPFGYAHVLLQIARESGYMTVRMEKPGVGDSRGPPCASLDFQRELAAYRAAFSTMTKLAGVDPSRIFILGLSNGGGFAPLVAQGEDAKDFVVKGYVVVGGWSRLGTSICWSTSGGAWRLRTARPARSTRRWPTTPRSISCSSLNASRRARWSAAVRSSSAGGTTRTAANMDGRPRFFSSCRR